MIFLSANTTNNVVLTLNENNIYTGSTSWIFSVTNISSKRNKIFMASDLSAYPCRYNQFNITVSGSGENLSGGTINLTDYGNYKYEVYASDSPSLDISNKTLVETGVMYLTGTTSSHTSYTPTDPIKVIYKP